MRLSSEPGIDAGLKLANLVEQRGVVPVSSEGQDVGADTLLRNFEIGRIAFDADETPSGIASRDSSRARA